MLGAAETLLQNLQRVLLESAQAASQTATPTERRDALRRAEREYGAQATHYGRALHDLVVGSHAWDLFEPPAAHKPGLPRVYELCHCEPLLRVMRESGELAERERLLRERDQALAALWQGPMRTPEAERLASEEVYAHYFDAVRQASAKYQSHYQTLRRTSKTAIAPLAGPRVRSRPFLQPPLMALLFSACHTEGIAQEYRKGGNTIRLLASDETALNRESLSAWAAPQISPLDDMTWDVAALAVSAFYARTEGTEIDVSFPFLLDDYFQWRGVDPRKRSRELRHQIEARLELLCSDRMQVRSETELWLADPETGRRQKTPVVAEGSFLVKRSRFFRRAPGLGDPEPDAADGYLLSLGEWARKFVEERAMLGVFVKKLAEYDLQRQRWERQIGWYLVFQMNNQGSKMTFREVSKEGKTQTQITPQHPLRMKTVLAGSHLSWEDMARTNPGKVIRQWTDALETLRRDGIIGPTRCLDGAADGSDLPVRGRLLAMLERRYEFVPGRELLPHLKAKREAATRHRHS